LLIAVYFLPLFLVAVTGKGQLQNRHPKARHRHRRFIPFNFLLSLAAPHLHGVLVLVTGNKLIARVVVTGDNCSPVPLSLATKLLPVSLSPVSLSLVSTTPAITENP
jgi:hypothetical protein